MKIYDAIVIGAGPAGSMFAYNCAQMGREVLVLEGGSHTKRKVCGEYLCPEGVELLIDSGLESIVNNFPVLTGMVIYPPHGERIDTNFPPKNNRPSFGISVNRQVFDQNLIDAAINAGANIIFDRKAISINYNGSYWTIETLGGECFHSRLLIGADGRNSIVARTLKLQRKSKHDRIAIHTWLKTDSITKRKGEMHIFDNGNYIGVDPTGENELNISLVCNASEIKEYDGIYNLFKYYLDKTSDLPNVNFNEDTKLHTTYPIENNVSDIISNNCALVGDAAGFIDPITGEGIFNALKSSTLITDALKEHSSYIDFGPALSAYKASKSSFFKEKTILNKVFQRIIRSNFLMKMIAFFLKSSQKRRDIFIGIIGNIYSPLEGLRKFII